MPSTYKKIPCTVKAITEAVKARRFVEGFDKADSKWRRIFDATLDDKRRLVIAFNRGVPKSWERYERIRITKARYAILPARVTLRYLISRGACTEGLQFFERTFPKGVNPTEDIILSMRKPTLETDDFLPWFAYKLGWEHYFENDSPTRYRSAVRFMLNRIHEDLKKRK